LTCCMRPRPCPPLSFMCRRPLSFRHVDERAQAGLQCLCALKAKRGQYLGLMFAGPLNQTRHGALPFGRNANQRHAPVALINHAGDLTAGLHPVQQAAP
jgi:hypothetical protein